MMRLIDYIYFRFAKAYFKWDGESGITGIMAVALFVSLIIIDILGIIYINIFTDEFRTQNKENVSLVGIIIIVVVIVFSLRKYKNKFLLYEKKWGNEERSKKIINGFLILIIFMLPIALPIIYLNVFK